MPYYVLNRTYNFHSINGGCSFVKGEPAWVIPPIEKEVIALGAVRAEGDTPSLIEEPKTVVQAPMGIERQEDLYAAFDMLIERNDSKDFTAQGVPTVKAIEKIVGFDVDRMEVVEAWGEHKIAKAEAK